MKCKETVGLLPVKTLVQHKVQRYNFLCFHFLSISYKTKILQFSELQDFSFLFIRLLWSRRGLNPRPNRDTLSFLHAYSGLDFRAGAGPGPPTQPPYPLRFHPWREAAADYPRFSCASGPKRFGARVLGETSRLSPWGRD